MAHTHSNRMTERGRESETIILSRFIRLTIQHRPNVWRKQIQELTVFYKTSSASKL